MKSALKTKFSGCSKRIKVGGVPNPLKGDLATFDAHC